MRSNSNNNDSDSWSNDGSSMHRVKKASAWSIPFAFAITLEIFFSCIAITAALLIVSTANTSTSNNICVEQGIDSIQQLSDSIQQRIADIVTITLNDTVAGPMLAIKETARIHSLNFVDPANYDRLWPHFYQQIKGYDAVSLIYYGDATTKDFVGVRVVSQTPASTQYGVDLMDETSSRCPQTCPSAMTSDTRPGIRFKYNLDDSGSISGAPYDSASFDPTGRTWFTLATSRPELCSRLDPCVSLFQSYRRWNHRRHSNLQPQRFVSSHWRSRL
ncbi:hypothetical protein BC829DRAFT_263273 [Chytridium lagenaria]|nr:hypothetical protein BC829DRAFT_263273 [Chytridium lagenaria]